MSDFPLVADDANFEAAQAFLEAADLGDGLPLVPPTATRLAAMLAGIAEPDSPIGFVPPLFGELTPRAIAYNAVMAGCRPAELVVVTAALTACLEAELNLLGLMTTTGSACIATIVHGPIVQTLDLNASVNCLGPGNRANATIGRAISLCLRNIGGARAGSGDMATCGQPGKYTFCFAEGNDGPFSPLNERLGAKSPLGAVTVLGVSGTAEIVPLRDDEGGDAGIDGIIEALSVAIIAAVTTTGASRQPQLPQQLFILPPELATRIGAAGIQLAELQERVWRLGEERGHRIAPSPLDIHPVVTGGPGVKIAYLPMWGGGSRLVTRVLPPAR